ncbi:hypothetical protein ABID21_002468 [Pseudorhizobium tarimense]|uniref:Glycosyltransferase n=1 Tax=Pseudorhizobium tarimense TaxID=1079109 RepID=A0ABV2H762_9HYPH|nr:hypothetical protein [Pseudorhizobium tarimense]MCJ8519319.1 hypothetical protein [Pseudorhizobium tarimense]
MASSNSPDPVNVICMKWGTLYGPEYVNNLFYGVRRHLRRAHRFVCFTDDAGGLDTRIQVEPLPYMQMRQGETDLRWRKLSVLASDLADLSGPTLFLDLDLVVIDQLDPFFDLDGRFYIIRDDDLFRAKPLRKLNHSRDRFLSMVGNSSVFRFEFGHHADLLEDYLADPERAAQEFEHEQQFLSDRICKAGELRYWPAEWCVSFKNACVPRYLKSFFADPKPPVGARVVVFAANPKMSEVLAGGGQKWYRRIGDVGWLRQAWTTLS